jgi:hypothetical protein
MTYVVSLPNLRQPALRLVQDASHVKRLVIWNTVIMI